MRYLNGEESIARRTHGIVPFSFPCVVIAIGTEVTMLSCLFLYYFANDIKTFCFISI